MTEPHVFNADTFSFGNPTTGQTHIYFRDNIYVRAFHRDAKEMFDNYVAEHGYPEGIVYLSDQDSRRPNTYYART